MEFEFDQYTCSNFEFNRNDTTKLMFFTATEIIQYDYMETDFSEQEKTIKTMKNMFYDPPIFGIFSECQTKAIVTSVNDILFIDLTKSLSDGSTGFELDIDEKESLGDILNIITDNKYFYVISNKK